MGQSQPQPCGCGDTPSVGQGEDFPLSRHFLGEMGNVMGCRKIIFCDFTRGVIGCGRKKAVTGKGVGLSDLRRNKNCEIEGSGVRKMSYHTIHTLAVFVMRLGPQGLTPPDARNWEGHDPGELDPHSAHIFIYTYIYIYVYRCIHTYLIKFKQISLLLTALNPEVPNKGSRTRL